MGINMQSKAAIRNRATNGEPQSKQALHANALATTSTLRTLNDN